MSAWMRPWVVGGGTDAHGWCPPRPGFTCAPYRLSSAALKRQQQETEMPPEIGNRCDDPGSRSLFNHLPFQVGRIDGRNARGATSCPSSLHVLPVQASGNHPASGRLNSLPEPPLTI